MIKLVPNRHRGEAIIEVDDQRFLLRGTFEAIAQIEDIQEGRFARQIVYDLQVDKVSLRDLVKIAKICWVDDGRMSLEEMGNVLMPLGKIELAEKILPIIEYALLGRAMGDEPPVEDEDKIIREPEAYPFRQVLGIAVARLGMSEEEFWASVPNTIFAAIRELHGPITKSEKAEKWREDTKSIYDALDNLRAANG